jgi:SAM-dependent methyltransferase
VTDTFPPGFFSRADETDDRHFYGPPRMVTHIDAGAIAYDELGLGPSVLDLCSSWVSHFRIPPPELTVLGMNPLELAANTAATARVVRDLNVDPTLPFAPGSFDDAVCCVSVDYLTRPVEVFAEVARVLRPGGRFVCTWSNRCFPTKVIRGWLAAPEPGRPDIVAAYFAAAPGWRPATVRTVIGPGRGHDPLWAVWASRETGPIPPPPPSAVGRGTSGTEGTL